MQELSEALDHAFATQDCSEELVQLLERAGPANLLAEVATWSTGQTDQRQVIGALVHEVTEDELDVMVVTLALASSTPRWARPISMAIALACEAVARGELPREALLALPAERAAVAPNRGEILEGLEPEVAEVAGVLLPAWEGTVGEAVNAATTLAQ